MLTLPGARRARDALLTNAVSSVGNLSLSIGVARNSSLPQLGQYGVAFAIYVLTTGAVRAAVADTVLSETASVTHHRSSIRRAVLLAIGAGLLTLLSGLALWLPYLLWLGCLLPGICVYDYIKAVHLGTGSHRRALAQETVWTAVTLPFAVACALHVITSVAAFGAWAGACALIGLVHSAILHYDLRPAWNANREEARVALAFGLDFIVGSGVAQATTVAVAAMAGTAVTGALRGAGTVLAPLTIISATLPSLVIPALARARREGPAQAYRTSVRVAVLLGVGAVPVITGILLLPSWAGQLLLGSNWPAAHAVLPAIAAELFFALQATVPFAGHRVERVGFRTVAIRAARTPVNIVAVVGSAVAFGAQGAGWSMAGMALVGTTAWWISYRRLLAGSAQRMGAEQQATRAQIAVSVAPHPATVSPTAAASAFPMPGRGPRQAPLSARFAARTAGRTPGERSGVPDQLDITENVGARVEIASTRSGWFARFPVTSLMLIQYGALAVWPGWKHGNPNESFIVWLVAVGTFAAFSGEFIAARIHTGRRIHVKASVVTPASALVVTLVGLGAAYVSALLGARTYATQVGATSVSPLARVATPLTAWALIGCALTLCCYASGQVDRRTASIRLIIAVVLYAGYSLMTARAAPLAQFALAVAVGALVTGLVRPRIIVLAAAIGFLVWPALYDVRNASRSNVAVGAYGQEVSATDRLREDIFIGSAGEYPAPLGIQASSPIDIIHYGLIPSAIDPFQRPNLETDHQLSLATGSTGTNSATFTVFGNIRAVSGTKMLMLFMLALGIVVSRLSRVISPLRLSVLMSLVHSVMWIESIYPDNFAAVLQTVVSTGIVLGLIRVVRHLRGLPKPAQGAVSVAVTAPSYGH